MIFGIFFGEQWREIVWGLFVFYMVQLEYVVSQLIMVQRLVKGLNFNSIAEFQSVLFFRLVDGVGFSMVEYVLVLFFGGQELDV